MSVVADQRIDFHQLSKPANLKNSAVLRMLEEEENRKRNGGQPNLKQVVWPPPADEDFNNVSEEAPVYAQGGPQYQNQQPSPVQQQNSVSPVSPRQVVSPQQFGAPQQQQQQQQPRGWGSVHSPVSAPPQPQFQPQPAPQLQSYRPVEPPPSTITLRPEAPVSQAPAPVYTSQPATASLRGGVNMRGDQKWPPENVRARMQAENDQRQQLAKGPEFRPRKVKKDYSQFFAQHALTHAYPGYRVPPGTQHYTEEQSGVSSY